MTCPILSQIVLNPTTVNYLLAAIVALQTWIVRRSFALDKKVSLIVQRLNSCQCPAGFGKARLNDNEND